VNDTTKYDVVCLERGDIDYILFVADQLSSDAVPPPTDMTNYAEALRGIARAVTELEDL
jgi:hypothetical protein